MNLQAQLLLAVQLLQLLLLLLLQQALEQLALAPEDQSMSLIILVRQQIMWETDSS